jgi:hypothetical protein
LRSSQEKFEAALEAIAVERDLELVTDRRFSNVGTYRVVPRDGFTPVLQMRFDFQDDYASFDDLKPSIGDREKMLRDFAGGPIYPHGTHFPCVRPHELEARVLSAVRRCLDEARARAAT